MNSRFLRLLSILIVFLNSVGFLKAEDKIAFKEGEIYSLDKMHWDFYPGRTYQDIKDNPSVVPQSVEVPGNWTSVGYPAHGYGTYIVRFSHNIGEEEHLVLKLMSVGTAYELYINGEKKVSVGKFSRSPEGAKPDFKPQNIIFEPGNNAVVEIAIQVSNYHYRNGGLWFTPSVGLLDTMQDSFHQSMISDAFLAGTLFVLFCYFIAFYYIKTDDKSSLYFAAMCFFATLRIVSTGNILMKQIPIHIPWEIVIKSEYLSLVMMLMFGILYVTSLFPRDTNRNWLTGIIIVQSTIGLFMIILPVNLASYIIPYYLFLCAFLLLYTLNIVVKAIIVKRMFSLWVGVTFLIVFFAAVNDMLHSQAIFKTFYQMPIAIFFFAVVQALTLTRKFSLAFKEVESLSLKLKNINQNQKEIISERTSLLNMQAQELQRSNQIKDKVFSIIAHDLRAPIKSLSTVLAWVADDDLTFDELKKSLGSISKNVDMLNLTLENLLQWSRNQLNGFKNEPELIDARKPIQDMMELYKIQLIEKNISMKLTTLDRIPVYVDKHHLNLLLRNLISNAIKFTRKDGIIEISSNSLPDGNTQISIKDNGVGMSEDAIRKVFSQTEHYTTFGTGNEKGTGLGLLLCKEYVENSAGKIWIESEPNAGTTIHFTLPGHSV